MDIQHRVLCYQFFSALFEGKFSTQWLNVWPVIALLTDVDVDLVPHQLDGQLSLQRAWAKTFYGVGEDTVGLTESSWSNALRLQAQEPCRAAQAAYRAAGVQPALGDDILFEDHLSPLLGFMGWCLETHYDTHRTHDFFAQHFGAWIDAFVLASTARLEDSAAKALLLAFQRFMESERTIWSTLRS